MSCAEMGLKPHRPSAKSTDEISKALGDYQISNLTGSSEEMLRTLSKDLMSCGSTTFSMPRGHSVGTFIKELFEQELTAAQKLSFDGKKIDVLIKEISLKTTSKQGGEWVMDIDYKVGDKTINIKNSIEFESKVSLITSCTYTASVFEDALADSFVEFFKRLSK